MKIDRNAAAAARNDDRSRSNELSNRLELVDRLRRRASYDATQPVAPIGFDDEAFGLELGGSLFRESTTDELRRIVKSLVGRIDEHLGHDGRHATRALRVAKRIV